MNLQHNISLADHSTMALGGKVDFLYAVTTKEELVEALNFAKTSNLRSLIIGSGSNIVWRDGDFNGLVIVSNLKALEKNWTSDSECLVKVAAGEIWDEVVDNCVRDGLSGIEALSLIPGTAGATPVQNVGAYGQEIAETLVELEAYDAQTEQFVTLTNSDCDFGYRTSRFKTREHGRFYITSITLKLSKKNPEPPFYGTVETYLNEHQITEFTPQIIRDAVIDIRSQKLPDPYKIHNTGSFFANPIIPEDKYNNLKQSYPDMPSWNDNGGSFKIPAAWLIEQAGFKDYHDESTGMATWPNQPLVLVNENAKSSTDLFTFRDHIIKTIEDKFDITLTQEPELLP
jgi:UDP-N-acetylmuramate dehydrogenase